MFTSVHEVENIGNRVHITVQFGTREQVLCEYEECGEFHEDWQALILSYDLQDFWQAGQFVCQISDRLAQCDWTAIHQNGGYGFDRLFTAVCDTEFANWTS